MLLNIHIDHHGISIFDSIDYCDFHHYDSINNYNIIASSNHGFYQSKWLLIKCGTWTGTWNGGKCHNQHHDSRYRTTDMTSCWFIAKRLSVRELIMSVQEVLVIGCACVHVCYAWVRQEPIWAPGIRY